MIKRPFVDTKNDALSDRDPPLSDVANYFDGDNEAVTSVCVYTQWRAVVNEATLTNRRRPVLDIIFYDHENNVIQVPSLVEWTRSCFPCGKGIFVFSWRGSSLTVKRKVS